MFAQSMGETPPMGSMKLTIIDATATFITNPIADTKIKPTNCLPIPSVPRLSKAQNLFQI